LSTDPDKKFLARAFRSRYCADLQGKVVCSRSCGLEGTADSRIGWINGNLPDGKQTGEICSFPRRKRSLNFYVSTCGRLARPFCVTRTVLLHQGIALLRRFCSCDFSVFSASPLQSFLCMRLAHFLAFNMQIVPAAIF